MEALLCAVAGETGGYLLSACSSGYNDDPDQKLGKNDCQDGVGGGAIDWVWGLWYRA